VKQHSVAQRTGMREGKFLQTFTIYFPIIVSEILTKKFLSIQNGLGDEIVALYGEPFSNIQQLRRAIQMSNRVE